ncbi:MAG: DUF2007 domain-containing protein [Bacteroidetes bacterium]|nr:DUF2007 domain-containing protein [Bacteroidota bacterium]MBS1649399.1 DUF2007 domain-containing protein [Bacteroidota bacterium]
MQPWYLLKSTRNIAEANIVKGLLQENDIPVQLLNKQDSSYLNFGDIEIYVPDYYKNVAENLLHKALLN